MKHILFISKSPLNLYPRLQSIPYTLSKKNKVTVISPQNIPETLMNNPRINHIRIEIDNHQGLGSWLAYRNKVRKIFIANYKLIEKSIIYFSSADSIIPLCGIIPKSKTVLQINELHEESILYQLALKSIIKDSWNVVVPEKHRAKILKDRLKLSKIPFVLPNKSIFPLDNKLHLETKEKINKLKKLKAKGKKVILYQGHLGLDRNLHFFLDALSKAKKNYYLVLLGKDHGLLKKLEKLNNYYCWLGVLPSPQHRYLAKYVDYGLIYYNPDSNNNLYCAPNKLWEYSEFGLPIISNILPGVSPFFDKFQCGEMYEDNNLNSCLEALEKLEHNYEKYTVGSHRMYQNLDYENIIEKIVNL